MESLAPRPRVNVALRLAAMDRREPMWCGGKNVADVVMAQRDGGDRGELRGAAVVESIGIDGEQRTDPVERTHRQRPGHVRGDIAVEHGKTRGEGKLLGASRQPWLKFVERHRGCRHR